MNGTRELGVVLSISARVIEHSIQILQAGHLVDINYSKESFFVQSIVCVSSSYRIIFSRALRLCGLRFISSVRDRLESFAQ